MKKERKKKPKMNYWSHAPKSRSSFFFLLCHTKRAIERISSIVDILLFSQSSMSLSDWFRRFCFWVSFSITLDPKLGTFFIKSCKQWIHEFHRQTTKIDLWNVSHVKNHTEKVFLFRLIRKKKINEFTARVDYWWRKLCEKKMCACSFINNQINCII